MNFFKGITIFALFDLIKKGAILCCFANVDSNILIIELQLGEHESYSLVFNGRYLGIKILGSL